MTSFVSSSGRDGGSVPQRLRDLNISVTKREKFSKFRQGDFQKNAIGLPSPMWPCSLIDAIYSLMDRRLSQMNTLTYIIKTSNSFNFPTKAIYTLKNFKVGQELTYLTRHVNLALRKKKTFTPYVVVVL